MSAQNILIFFNQVNILIFLNQVRDFNFEDKIILRREECNKPYFFIDQCTSIN